jgi:hypothetical protein
MTSKVATRRMATGRYRALRGLGACVAVGLLATLMVSGCGGKYNKPVELKRTVTMGLYAYQPYAGFTGARYLSITEGSLYVTFETEGQVRAFHSTGTPIPGNLVRPFTGLTSPTVVATGRNLLAVVDKGSQDTVRVYNVNGGAPLHSFRDPDWLKISALAVDDSGYIYVADVAKDFVRAYRADGRPRFEVDLADSGFGIGHVMAPTGITLDAGTLLITEAHAQKVQVQRIRTDRPQTGIPFSATLPFLSTFVDAEGNEIPLSDPIGVAAGEDSSIFVLDRGLDMILRYDDAGNSIVVVNSPESGGPTNLAGAVSIVAYNQGTTPEGIRIPATVYILDKTRGLIHRWDPKR